MFQRYEEGAEENQRPTGQTKGQRWAGKKQHKATGNGHEWNLQTVRKNSKRG